MRRWWLMTIAVLLVAAPAAAQQGSVQVIAASNVTTGDPERTGALQGYQPDFGVSWFQPTTNWARSPSTATRFAAGTIRASVARCLASRA